MPVRYQKRMGGPLKQSLDRKFDAIEATSDGGICGAPDCDKRVAGRGLCRMHYARVRRHGHLDGDRNAQKRSHPLHSYWNNLRQRDIRCEAWNNFWTFVNDVGDRPSENHFLRREDTSKVIGPGNFKWVSTNSDVIKFPESVRRRSEILKRKYNISLSDYDAMLRSQNFKCAICFEGETYISGKNGKTFALAVDHDHETGFVRGLLCAACNRAVGMMKDCPKRFASAVAYLGRAHIKMQKEKTA